MFQNTKIQHLIEDNIELFSLPDTIIQLKSLMDDPNSTIEQISNLIMQDGALTVKLLKIVNSSYYNFSKPIDTITQAINIVGIRELSKFVFAAKMINHFNQSAIALVTANDFWRHNLACATAASVISTELKIKKTEQIYIAGLIHDIGKLVLFNSQPKLCEALITKMLSREIQGDDLEFRIIGYTHDDVSAALLKKWNFPEMLITTTQFHHQPQDATSYTTEVAIIHIANTIANLIEKPISFDDTQSIHHSAWEVLNIEPHALIELTHLSELQYQQTASIIIAQKAA
ncbi:Predicted signal transduction protein [hydrothermal vent metagenome]|uniref:Predicted signal transduction protein n=1 Tax=hydrothermal vent metagenome TaxID=652676 RepID=A0A3B1AJ56_9ZZZZ